MKSKIILFLLMGCGSLFAEWKQPAYEPQLTANASCMVNDQLILAVYNQYLYSSNDRGKTWKKDSFALITEERYITKQSIQFSNNVGYIYSLSQDKDYHFHAEVFMSSDMAKTWTKVSLNELMKYDYMTKFQLQGQSCFIYTEKTIQYTDNNGQNWQLAGNAIPDSFILDLKVISDQEWYLVTTDINRTSLSIHSSPDKGKNWTLIKEFHYDNTMFFPSIPYGAIQKVGGKLYLMANIYVMSCGAAYDHSIFYTLQQVGHSWNCDSSSTLKLDGISQLYFVSSDVIYAVSDNTIFKSTDGGKTWFPTFRLDWRYGNLNGIQQIGGTLYALTPSGLFASNSDMSKDANLGLGMGVKVGEVTIAPNPAGQHINVKISWSTTSWDFCLFNAAGQLVLARTGNSVPSLEVETLGLAKGVYTYQVVSGNNNSSGKLIIE